MVSSATAAVRDGVLDRHRPAALQPYITNEEWQYLRDDIGDALKPIKAFVSLQRTIAISIFVIILCIIVGGVFAPMLGLYRNTDNYGRSPGLNPIAFLAVFLSIPCFMLFVILSACYRSCFLEPRLTNKLDDIIDKHIDLMRGGVTLHLQPDVNTYNTINSNGHSHRHSSRSLTDYTLTVSVNEEAAYRGSLNHGHDDDASDQDRLRNRLEELEDARKYLTDEEYRRKRSQILDLV